MNCGIFHLIASHPTTSTIVASYLFLAAVSSLNKTWDGFYPLFYRFVQALMPLAQHEAARFPILAPPQPPAADRQETPVKS